MADVAWYTYRCPSCNARTAFRLAKKPRVAVEYKRCKACSAIYRTPDQEWQHMTTGQRIRYFLNDWSVLILLLCSIFAVGMYYASGKTEWKPSAWVLGITAALLVPFWLRKYFLVKSSIARTATLGTQQHLEGIQGLDNISHAGTICAEGSRYTPPAQPEVSKPKGGMGLHWKIRLAILGLGVIWAILDSQWKTIDKYFPKLNEVLHSGTPTSEGDIDYLTGHLSEDMKKWSGTCSENTGFQECRTRLMANKPVLADMKMRVGALNDAWVKELGERTVPAKCQTEMSQMLKAYKDYVGVEGEIVTLVEAMDSEEAQHKLQPRFSEASDREDTALNELRSLRTSNACDGY